MEAPPSRRLEGLSGSYMALLRVGFLTGSDSWLQKQKLTAKYLKMRLEGVVYPDVFALPDFIGARCEFLCDGDPIVDSKYDLLMSELNGSDRQLEYLNSVVAGQRVPVAVIPGPPEIIARGLTQHRLNLVCQILSGAEYVWAYSETIRDFCDGLVDGCKAQVIPWPFDTATAVRIGATARPKTSGKIQILLNAPLRFHANTHNYPFLLKSALLRVWNDLPMDVRQRVTFHSFIYHPDDEASFHNTGFSEGLPIVLERNKSYSRFIRFIAECDAVVNVLYGNVLGRITFLAGALDRPGVFGDTSEINRKLYPTATVPLLSPGRLEKALRDLFSSLIQNTPDCRFLPCHAAVREVGDFPMNASRFRSIIEDAQETYVPGG